MDQTIGGQQVVIDPIKNPGDPNTVTLPETGHTLSLPNPGEGIMGYFVRTQLQTGIGPVAFVIQLGVTLSPVNAANNNDWPRRVDEYAGVNSGLFAQTGGDPYLSGPQAAQAASLAAAWNNQLRSSGGKGSIPVGALSDADKLYIYTHYAQAFDVLSGSHADVASVLVEGATLNIDAQGNQASVGAPSTAVINAVAQAQAAVQAWRQQHDQTASAKHPHRKG